MCRFLSLWLSVSRGFTEIVGLGVWDSSLGVGPWFYFVAGRV